MKNTANIILGIDPGTLVMGFGLIIVQQKKIFLREMGVLKLSSYKDQYYRLQLIQNKIAALIEKYQPQSFAIEAPFYGKNVQSMLKLGRAQGVAIAAAMQAGIPVTEYSPKKIKQSVTGNGNASKEQVSLMLQRILQFPEIPNHLDATDALAAAVCHHFQGSAVNAVTSNSSGKWSEFIKQNPGRIRMNGIAK